VEDVHWENIVVDGWLSGLSQAPPKLPPYAIYYDNYDFATAKDTKNKMAPNFDFGVGAFAHF